MKLLIQIAFVTFSLLEVFVLATQSHNPHLHSPTETKGLAYTLTQRQDLKIQGLLPPRVLSPEDQDRWCVDNIKRLENGLDKYIYLRDLQDSNERMFYSCVMNHVDLMLPVVYTPSVGAACINYGLIYRRPRGMFISFFTDKGNVKKVLENWPTRDIRAIVVTDGGRILGLGDLGANGMGIPVGKMALYTALGGVDPKYCLPITLDVGTENEKYLEAGSTYIGTKQKRPALDEYNAFVDEFMKAVVDVFGEHTLIQFEDFKNDNAFPFLDRYRNKYTMFNDDIQGTGAVALAGLMAAETHAGMTIADTKVLFLGAGTAALGIANLIVKAMGGDVDAARQKILLKDINQVLVKEDEKRFAKDDGRRNFCHELPKENNIVDVVEIIKWFKPNVLIGVTGKGGLFTQQVLEAMAEVSTEPIILPLSNPTKNSECTAEEAYRYTNGKCMFASGSPFDPVEVDGSTKTPTQCNNAYIFPGVAFAIVSVQITTVKDEMFIIAAETLANKCMKREYLDKGMMFPPLKELRSCSLEIAAQVAEYAYEKGLAALKPKPNDIKDFLKKEQYNPNYGA